MLQNVSIKLTDECKLKNADSVLKEVQANHDLTKTQRENDKKLRDEAKLKEEQSGEFYFKVRGPPWDRKIIQIRKVKENN